MQPISIVYINLESRPDRRAFMERQLSALGLSARRIEAVTPTDIGAEELERYCGKSAVRPMAPPELACAMSHVRAWQADRWTLVLEDDAMLSPRLPAFLRAFAENPPDVDVVKLEIHYRTWLRALPPSGELAGVRLHRFRTTVFGCACYLISPRGARYLTGREDLFREQIDVTMFRVLAMPARGLRTVIADPALAQQLPKTGPNAGEARSDIARSRSQNRAPISFEIAKVVDHLWHLPQGLHRRSIKFDAGAAEAAPHRET